MAGERTYIDGSGNFINLETCAKFPGKPVQIEHAQTPKPSLLLRTRLGNYFLLDQVDGTPRYRVFSPAQVESWCLGNGHDPDEVLEDATAEEPEVGQALNGEM